MSIILGIDSSLTSTGLARLDTARLTDNWAVSTIKTTAPKVPSRAAAYRRLCGIARAVLAFAEGIPDLVVLEAPAYSSITGHVHDRAGLWWMLYGDLTDYGAELILVVEPNVRAKYATGNGRSGKDEVMIAAVKRYPAADITNNDEADAVLLASMGARTLGEPIEPPGALTKSRLDAMKTINMPPRV